MKALGWDLVTKRLTQHIRDFAVTESKFRFLQIKIGDQETKL